jgi:tripartite-type tricarboxylate transporter receptor subunit TctC
VSALRELLRSPDVYQKLLDSGFEPVDDTPVEFAATVKDDVRRFTAMATRLGIVPGRAGTSAASGGS